MNEHLKPCCSHLGKDYEYCCFFVCFLYINLCVNSLSFTGSTDCSTYPSAEGQYRPWSEIGVQLVDTFCYVRRASVGSGPIVNCFPALVDNRGNCNYFKYKCLEFNSNKYILQHIKYKYYFIGLASDQLISAEKGARI